VPVGFILTRPISLLLVACISLALYFSFRPKPWQGQSGIVEALDLAYHRRAAE